MRISFLLSSLLILSGCEITEPEFEICEQGTCSPTEVGPNDPVFDDIQRIPSTSGSIRILSYQKTQFPEEYDILDIRYQDSKVWIFIEKTLSTSIKYYELYESGPNFDLNKRRCQWLNDNRFSEAMLINDQEILIPEKNSQFTLRSFHLNDCSEQAAISTAESVPFSPRHKLAGIRDNELFYKKGSKLAALNLPTLINNSEDDELVLGTKTGRFSSLRAMTLKEHILWVIIGNDLWKINLTNRKLGWADLSRLISGPHDLTLNVNPQGELVLSQWRPDHSLESWAIDVKDFN